MQRIGIVGAGRFGATLAEFLVEKGSEVVIIDSDPEKVKRMSALVARAVHGDAADSAALREAGFAECDAVVVAIGSNLEASILSTILLKELKVPHVVARASSDVHRKVLERVGADRIVFLTKDMARRLAKSLHAPTVLDYFEISDGVSIMEMKAPRRLVGKTLSEARIRNVYGVTVLALRRAPGRSGKQKSIIAPTGEDFIMEGDVMTVFGADKDLEEMQEK